MDTHGNITLAPYVHGFDSSADIKPSHRSEFITYVDFFGVKRFIVTGLFGTTTVISDYKESGFKLDRIRYTLSPGFRYEFP